MTVVAMAQTKPRVPRNRDGDDIGRLAGAQEAPVAGAHASGHGSGAARKGPPHRRGGPHHAAGALAQYIQERQVQRTPKLRPGRARRIEGCSWPWYIAAKQLEI